MSAHMSGPWRWSAHTKDHIGAVYAEPTKGHAYAVAVKPQYVSAEQWAKDAPILASALELSADNARLRTVNEALVKALENITPLFQTALLLTSVETARDGMAYVRAARAALKLAKGEG